MGKNRWENNIFGQKIGGKMYFFYIFGQKSVGKRIFYKNSVLGLTFYKKVQNPIPYKTFLKTRSQIVPHSARIGAELVWDFAHTQIISLPFSPKIINDNYFSLKKGSKSDPVSVLFFFEKTRSRIGQFSDKMALF